MEPAKLENVKLIADSPAVDLCIMLDCTGSMSSYIEMSKNKIKDIMENVKKSYPGSEMRVGIVAYRDVQDNKRSEILHFTDSSDVAKKFLMGLKAEGGGDTPEDVNGAFQIALFQLKWSNPVKLLVHIADAPCHGTSFHSCDDSHPKGHKSDMSWELIFKKLVDLRVDYLFLTIMNITDAMFKKFKEIAIKNGLNDYELGFDQEPANLSNYKNNAGAAGARAGGPATSSEDHFAKTIADKVKSCVGKELKKGFEKKLEKRTTENAEMVTKIKKTIAETVQKLDFEDLKTKYSDLSAKVGECILSSNNFIEALKDEDCLCLTFNIGRSQAAIVDPSQIIIKDVYPSFLTAGSFFYSTEFALKKNKLAHGGYEKNAEGLIIKGAAQEDITGVMPLFFCEENWRVAKLLMKPTIGWAVTLEPAGYTFEQMKVVPFMILAKLAQMCHSKQDSEFLKFQFELVKQTCSQIMKDSSLKKSEKKFDEDVMKLYEGYLKDTSLRTIDVIANNTALLAQLYIAKENGMAFSTEDEHFEGFVQALLEEEMRRRTFPLEEGVNVNQWILQILNIDPSLISTPVEAYKVAHPYSKKAIYADDFLVQLEKLPKKVQLLTKTDEGESKENTLEEKTSAIEETKENTKPINEAGKHKEEEKKEAEIPMEEHCFKRNGSYNEKQEKAIAEANKTLEKVVGYLYPLIALFGKKVQDPEQFKSWGLDSEAKIFSLYIQNKLETKNAQRREAFLNNKHINPWNSASSNSYILSWRSKAIPEEISKGISDYQALNCNLSISDQAHAFAYSEDMNEAAGALLGTRIGSGRINDFVNELAKGGAVLIQEKMRMLVGNWEGVRLYSDLQRWNIGKKKRNKISRAYPNMVFLY